MECYLDNSATTRVAEEAAEAVRRAMLEDFGNPSSLHNVGFEAEKHVKASRELFAGLLKCSPKNIIFTSGGTESNNTAIIGTAIARENRGKHMITTEVEHPAVANVMKFLESRGFEVDRIPTDGEGTADLFRLAEFIRKDTVLVSMMHVNNEIGTIEPVLEAGRIIHEKNPACLFHVDDVQGFGKLPLVPKEAHVDLLSVSSHKIHGPKGVGLLYKSDRASISPIMFGGGQMEGFRSGTENVPGISGFAAAAGLLHKELAQKSAQMREMREYFIGELKKIPDITINGPADPERSAPHIVSASIKDVRAEVLLHALEEKGIYISSGSACSSNHKSRSAVLAAIGVPDWAYESTVRFSFSIYTKKEELEYAIATLGQIIPGLRRFLRR